MANKYLKFVKWLDKKKELEFRFHVGVLEESNAKKDNSLPGPPLSHLDSRSLFAFLASKGLAEKSEENVFELNRVEQWKWNETIRELKKKEWRRHPLWIKLCNCFFFILVAVLGGLVGAIGNEIGILSFQKVNEKITQSTPNKTSYNNKGEIQPIGTKDNTSVPNIRDDSAEEIKQ